MLKSLYEFKDDAIRLLEAFKPDPCGSTLHRRDLYAIKEAKRIMKK